MRRPSGGGAGDPLGERLRLVAVAMAGALSLLVPIVLVALPPGVPTGETLRWGLAGASLGLTGVAFIGVGVVLAISAAGSEPGPGRSARVLVSLAFREGGGLLGLPLAFLGTGTLWAAALLGLAVVSILALLPPRSPAA